MANVKIADLKNEDATINLKGLIGSALTMDWKQIAMYEGRIFTTTIGTLSTGIVGGGAVTIPDIDLPEFLIDIPEGYVVVPISMSIQGNCSDAVADHDVLEAFICKCTDVRWDGTGTCTSETPICMKTVGGRTSVCRVRSAFNTVDITTAPVHAIDLAREEVKFEKPAAGETPVILRLDYAPKVPPFIVGPTMITGYWGGTSAVTGYAQLYWAEYETSELF
jgi:hypothetical protein